MNASAPVTLVIPAFNRADLIRETLDSALNQRLPFEGIVVVDDGSTDHTSEVLASYAGRITVLRQANQGVQAARNLGIAHARTEWVVLCDSDDLLEVDYLHTTMPWMQAHPEQDALYCNFVTFGDDGESRDKLSQGPSDFLAGARVDGDFVCDIPDLYGRTMRYQPLFHSGVMFRRALYDRVGGYDTKFRSVGAEDWEFTLRAIGSGQVGMCTKVLVRIRRHVGNDSADSLYMNRGEIMVLEHAWENHGMARSYETDIRHALRTRRLRVFNAAFAGKDFDLQRQMHEQLWAAGWTLPMRERVKMLMRGLPEPMRTWVWSWTQSVRR